MAGLDYSYVGILATLFAVGGYVFGWVSNPWNHALLMQWLLKKPFVVVVIRTLGGQITAFSYHLKEPRIEHRNMSFIPHDAFAVYKGSVPTYFFYVEDAKGVPFGVKEAITEQINARFRDPKYLNAVFLQAKAVYETMGLSRLDKIEKWVQYGIIGSAIIIVGLVLIFMHIENTGQMLATLIRQGGAIVQSTVENALG